MSAASEILFEKLESLDKQIQETIHTGGDTSELIKIRNTIRKQFEAASSALNEGKTTVLKG